MAKNLRDVTICLPGIRYRTHDPKGGTGPGAAAPPELLTLPPGRRARARAVTVPTLGDGLLPPVAAGGYAVRMCALGE